MLFHLAAMGFITTVSDLANSAELCNGCHSKRGQREYTTSMNNLVQKTGAIAMMVERTTDDPSKAKEVGSKPDAVIDQAIRCFVSHCLKQLYIHARAWSIRSSYFGT